MKYKDSWGQTIPTILARQILLLKESKRTADINDIEMDTLTWDELQGAFQRSLDLCNSENKQVKKLCKDIFKLTDYILQIINYTVEK